MSITSEQILTSVSTVVNEALSTYKQDQTILAKIEEGGSGKVLCSSGALKFYAYGEDDKNYNANQQVYVLVPQGDYSQKKIILGAYSIEDEEKKIYTSSNKLKDFVGVVDKDPDQQTQVPYSSGCEAVAITLTPKEDGTVKSFRTTVQIVTSAGNVIAETVISDSMLRGSRTLNTAIKYDFLLELTKGIDLKDTWTCQRTEIKINGEQVGDSTLDAQFNLTWSFGYLSPKKEIRAYFPEYYDDNYGYIEVIGDLKAGSIFNGNVHEVVLYTYQIGSGSSAAGTNWKQVGYFNNKITGGSLINSSCFEKSCKIDLTDLVYNNAETTKFKVRATLIDSDEWIESDIITVKNPNKEQITKETVNEGITLSLADGDSGVYNFYGLDNEIKNDEDKKSRYVQVKSDGEIESVTWDYPTILTGIEPLETQDEEDKFFYKIKRRCYNSYVNNTIKCTATFKNGTTAQADISLSFGGYGTQETPYSLNIDFDRDKKYLVCGEGPVPMRATLERTDGEAVTFNNIVYKWEWLADDSLVKFCDAAGNEISEPTGAQIYVKPPSWEKMMNGYEYNSIIKVTVEDVAVNDITALDLEAYLPLGLCGDTANTSTYMYQGPVRIVYDGLNECSYDSGKIVLYKDGKEIALNENTKLGKQGIFKNGNTPDGMSHYLTYIDSSENSIRLSPKTYTMVNDKPSVDTLYIPKENSGSSYLWAQPILTIRNRWTNTFYNWNGKGVQTNESYILTPFLAAGTLENDKTFTGTMLGEQDGTWGIFGYQEGIPRYSFTEKGTMYIGQKNGSHITFDDNGELYIYAKSFDLSTSDGSYIRSGSNGKLEMKSSVFDLSADNITINKSGLFINGGKFIIRDSSNISKLYFDGSDGQLTIDGKINTTSGKIGGWSIKETELASTGTYKETNFEVSLKSSGDNIGLLCKGDDEVLFSLSPVRDSYDNSKFFSGSAIFSYYRQIFVNSNESISRPYLFNNSKYDHTISGPCVLHHFDFGNDFYCELFSPWALSNPAEQVSIYLYVKDGGGIAPKMINLRELGD